MKKNNFTFFITDNYAEVYTIYPIIFDLRKKGCLIKIFIDKNLFFNEELLSKIIGAFKEINCDLIFSKRINQKQKRLFRIIKEFVNFFSLIHLNRRNLFKNQTIFIENSFRTKVSLIVVIYSFFFKNTLFVYDHGSKFVFYVNKYKKKYLFINKNKIYHLLYSNIELTWIRNNGFNNLVKTGFPIIPNKINKLISLSNEQDFFLICGRGIGNFISIDEYTYILNTTIISLRKYFYDKKIIYYPHPKERSLTLCNSIINKYKNVEIADLKYPSIDYVSNSIGVISILSSAIFLASAFKKSVIEYYPFKNNLKKFYPELNNISPYSKIGFPSARNVSDLEKYIESEFLEKPNKSSKDIIVFDDFNIDEIIKKVSD